MMIPVLRGLGCHTAIALVLFALVARDLLARAPDARGVTRAADLGPARAAPALALDTRPDARPNGYIFMS